MTETTSNVAFSVEPEAPDWRRVAFTRVGFWSFWRKVSLDVMDKAGDGFAHVKTAYEVDDDFPHPPRTVFRSRAFPEEIYRLRVGGKETLLTPTELRDGASAFFRLMRRAKWKLRDGQITIHGGTLGDRSIAIPPWSLEAVGAALAPFSLFSGDPNCGPYRGSGEPTEGTIDLRPLARSLSDVWK